MDACSFSVSSHGKERESKRETKIYHFSPLSSHKGAHPIHEVPPPWPNPSQRPQLLTPSYWESRLQHKNLGRRKHSVYNTCCSYCESLSETLIVQRTNPGHLEPPTLVYDQKADLRLLVQMRRKEHMASGAQE